MTNKLTVALVLNVAFDDGTVPSHPEDDETVICVFIRIL